MPAKWTFMVYMAGYNNLSPFALKDLDEMRRVGSSDEVQIAAFVKREEEGPAARRLIVGKDGKGEQPDDVGDADSGRPQTLLDFVRWAAEKAPADRYALVVWNHGSGWQPDDLDDLYDTVRGRDGDNGLTPREVGLRSTQEIGRSLFKPTLEHVFELPTSHDRGIASDDGTGHSLDTIELGRVLAAARESLGRPLDLLGMDACLMSTLEVAYQSRDDVLHVVGSEELEPGDGWPYADILGDLAANPAMDGAALGKAVVDRYVSSYEGTAETATQCAVDVTSMPTFTGALEDLAGALSTACADRDAHAAIMRAQSQAVAFHGELVDVRSFCERLADDGLPDPVRDAAKGAVAALEPVGYVVAEGHTGQGVDGVGGVTVYFPNPFDEISRFYGDLEFAKDLRWDEFLVAYKKGLRGG